MKKIKGIYLGMMAAALTALSGCQAEMNEPEMVAPVASKQANTTILEFKKQFLDQSVQCPMKDEASKTPYIIHGRVISSDASGNIYKSIVIQDETAAIPLSVNQGSTYVNYRIGQEVVIDCTGLYIGYYNGLQQLGWLGEPYNGVTQLGFMAWDLFLSHTEKNGFPNPAVKSVKMDEEWPADQPYCVISEISKLPTAGEELAKMQGQLVEFRNVSFAEGGKQTYAPYQESVNRTLVDANGSTMIVRTSGYSNFYNQMIPEGSGTVRGILSYYSGAYQLLLRGTGDVLITAKGQKNDPYTVPEAILVENTGASGWVKGYIVGSVKAGYNDANPVKDNSAIEWSANAELPNNLVIAPTADTKDWNKCIVVELPQGSAFREKGNLLDNPGVYGKEIMVQGTFANYLGMFGLVGNGGTANDVQIDGVVISGGGQGGSEGGLPQGDGSEASPWNATQMLGFSVVTGTNLYTDKWVNAYIVGYVDTGIKTYATAESAKFTAPATVATNLLLADSPTETDYTKCISVNLPTGAIRTALNLVDNPGNLGKLLKINGNITKYVGIPGVKDPKSYTLAGEGTGGGDTPTPEPTSGVIYEGLLMSDASVNWTMNADASGAMTTPWTWKTYTDASGNSKNYLNASAYAGSAQESQANAYSPAISLEGYKKVTMTFSHAAKFQTTLTTLCWVVVREVGTTTWDKLTIPTWPTAGAWTFVNAGNIDLTKYAGKKVEVGFHYGADSNGADTWEINNVKITGEK